MRFEISMTSDLQNKLHELRETHCARSRTDLVRDVSIEVLQQVIQEHPVDTGESQSAWKQCLSRLAGSDSEGLMGNLSTSQSKSTMNSNVQQTEDRERSHVLASSHVEYAKYLEYGTSRVPPIAMIRRSLLAVRGKIASLWRGRLSRDLR